MEKFKIIFFIFLLNIKFNFSIVVIPFKTFEFNEPTNYTVQSILESWRQNILYTNVSIGTPPQKITLIIDSKSYITNLFQHMCDIPISSYNSSKSGTFNIRQSITYYPMVKASIIDETIYFYNDLKMSKMKAYNLFKLIYSDNKKEDQSYMYEYHNFTCINVGLKLNYNREFEKTINLIVQLAQNFKESYDFTFKYTSDDVGMVIIGAEPHVYDPDIYSEKDYRTIGAEDIDLQDYRDWHLTFDEIYFPYKDKISGNIMNKKLNETKKIRIKFDLGIIYGSTDYKKMIKEYFFDNLVNNGKCWEEINGLETIYYCDKNKAENIIKNEFPTLYFKMNQFDKIFELNYKDLFREKNGNLYFLIIFSETPQNYFEIGKIFLKKYTFTFNKVSKTIGYYLKTKDSNNSDPDNGLFFTKASFIIIVAFVLIIFSVFGFFVGKYFYDKMRKRRMNELDDIYDYKPQENDSIDDKNTSNNSNDEGDHLGINEEEGNIN